MSAHLFVAPGSHLYVKYSAALKKLLDEAFVIEEIESLPNSVAVDHG